MMDHRQWKKINSIVDAALDLPEENRTLYIKEQCKGDEELEAQVTELLKSIKQSDTNNFLEGREAYPGTLAADLGKKMGDENKESSLIGKTIGSYYISELVAHGGMGSLFLAKRADEAYKGEVALKVLRRGMDTPSNRARFERERNILAKLDHPNIARLLDGGMTEEGLPYLVMEYVEGVSLVEYCNNHQLSINEPIELFKKICGAVQHAHRNTVIHRDLKPSNIFVTEDRTVKVLDFGIAKLFGPNSELNQFQTRTRSRMLTPGYAAPEQLSNQPVTTATDTYTLGILLYELLTGVHPFEPNDKSATEIETAILESTPLKPSNKFSQLTRDKQEQIAGRLSSTPQAVKNTLQGDLDAIIMKALRKEPETRYSSAEQLLDDLMRREQNQPIIAREDTWRYKSSKFIKRHKPALAVAAAFLVLIVGFISFYTWQITEERNRAQQEAQKAQQITNFLLGLYDTASNIDTVTVQQLMQQGLQETNKLKDQSVYPTLLLVMGRAYFNFGNYEKAQKLYQQTLDETRQMHGKNSSEYANALYRMGTLYSGNYDHNRALPFFRESYQLQSEILGANHVETAHTLARLADVLRHAGKLDSAEIYARKALDIHKQQLSPTHSNLLNSMINLANIMREQEQFDEAEELFLTAISRAENEWSGELSPSGSHYNDLAYLYRHREQYEKAINYYKKALKVNNNELPSGHPEILMTRRNLATSQYFAGQIEEAERTFKQNVMAVKDKFSSNHWRTAQQLQMLGLLLLQAQKYSKAEPYVRESTQICSNIFGKDHLSTAYSEGLLVASLKLQGKNTNEIDSLYQHHYQLFKKNADKFNKNGPNNITRLINIYEENKTGDSLITAYSKILDN